MIATSLAEKSHFRRIMSLPYGLYAWAVFLLFGVLTLPPLLLLPSLSGRRRITRSLARLMMRLIGMRIQVSQAAPLPYPCIIVANHSSYIDGVVLMAALPPRFNFVIKSEMARVPLAGMLLGRIGSQFVDRRDRARSSIDARRLLRRAYGGEALAFFPEGTFTSEVGVLPFHIGAFAAAARARVPLVPIAIRNARARLPPGSILPHPGIIEVRILSPLQATDAAAQREAAVQLRDASRQQILRELDEPDLAASAVPLSDT